jgi:hypothetical protein
VPVFPSRRDPDNEVVPFWTLTPTNLNAKSISKIFY